MTETMSPFLEQHYREVNRNLKEAQESWRLSAVAKVEGSLVGLSLTRVEAERLASSVMARASIPTR